MFTVTSCSRNGKPAPETEPKLCVKAKTRAGTNSFDSATLIFKKHLLRTVTFRLVRAFSFSRCFL
jgi:hypothetical protein